VDVLEHDGRACNSLGFARTGRKFLKENSNLTDSSNDWLIIEPAGNLKDSGSILSNLLNSRFLIRELLTRDIRARYIGSYLGLFWSVLNPLLVLALYTVVFSYILGIRFERSDSVGNFAVFLFCALLPWTAIQESTSRSAVCFLDHANLIKKVRFSLESLPFSLVLSSIVHQLIGTAAFLIILMISGSVSYVTIPLMIPLLFVQMLMMFGMALIFACLNVFFRDVLQVMNVLFMVLFWMTPIVYPRSMVPDNWLRFILDLNPLTHMVEAYRYSFLGVPVEPVGLVYWIIFSFLIFLFGRHVLKKTLHQLVDLL
jgi:ABC-type polysaccharide/polyol phosphate export permease